MAADDWKVVFALPNIELSDGFEHGIAVLVPASDARVQALRAAYPALGTFHGRFTDNFGDEFEPALLLVRSDAAETFMQAGALASFRDAIAVATVCRSRALELIYPRGHRVLYSDYFAIYPWMIDKHYEELIGSSPAILSLHETERLRAQSSPSVSRQRLSASDSDQPLVGLLLERWRERYSAEQPQWASLALFRSLNMAYHACLLPTAASDTTVYDVGRLVSLWVSAYEILVHPGEGGQANRDRVFALLEQVDWQLEATADPVYETGRGGSRPNRVLACWLYQKLYDCRNDFLHGNPVGRDNLLLPDTGRRVFDYAAPLYRLALSAFLPAAFELPAATDAEAMGRAIAGRMTFLEPQQMAEEALLTALEPEQAPRSRRRHRLRPRQR